MKQGIMQFFVFLKRYSVVCLQFVFCLFVCISLAACQRDIVSTIVVDVWEQPVCLSRTELVFLLLDQPAVQSALSASDLDISKWREFRERISPADMLQSADGGRDTNAATRAESLINFLAAHDRHVLNGLTSHHLTLKQIDLLKRFVWKEEGLYTLYGQPDLLSISERQHSDIAGICAKFGSELSDVIRQIGRLRIAGYSPNESRKSRTQQLESLMRRALSLEEDRRASIERVLTRSQLHRWKELVGDVQEVDWSNVGGSPILVYQPDTWPRP